MLKEYDKDNICSIDNTNIFNFLKQVPLLDKIHKDILLDIASKSVIKHYKKGDIVYRKGESSNWLYFVYSGNVAEFVGYNSSIEIIVKIRKKYDYIGEMGILINEPYPNTAIALEKLTLVSITKYDFMELASESPFILSYINRELIDRLVNSCKNIINAMYLDAPGRLAFTLVGLITDKNEFNNSMIRITHSELASTAGMARQTVSLLLGEWRQNGIVETYRGGIMIKDIDALMDIIINSELR